MATDKQTFSYEDFDNGTVFRHITDIKDSYDRSMEENRMQKRASEVGFKNFKRLLAQYKQKKAESEMPVIELNSGSIDIDGATDYGSFTTGEWHVDEAVGVWKYGNGANPIIACSHPIIPCKKKRSIDTGSLKYTLAWRRGGIDKKELNFTDIDAADMLSPTEIVKKLPPVGISVSGGERAKILVDYLRDMTDLNYNTMPEFRSVSRMGWNEEGFSPYVDGIDFDSSAAFAGAFKAIAQVGSYDKWLFEAKDARTYSTTAKIVLAASFAAPLIEKLGTLPFFVHLWSVESGTGKSVGQMLGASVWANPAPGGAFFPTFRSTSVGLEMMAGFLHSLPMFIDELQLAKDTHGNVKFNVYELASGSGKLRSNKSLGLNYTPTWANCFITSGETPITKETDGAGALNRVFEIECYADNKVINDGLRTANTLRENYGWAGKDYIEHLLEDGAIDRAKELYNEYYSQCMDNNTTEKQAMAASCILVADRLATDWIFQDGNNLTVKEISEFLKTRERVSLMERGYDILCDWVSINANKLRGIREEDRGECFGIVDGDTACIIRSVFNRVCAENEIDQKGILSHLRARNLIETSGKGYTKTKRIGQSQVANCIWLKLPKDDETMNEIDENGDLPF